MSNYLLTRNPFYKQSTCHHLICMTTQITSRSTRVSKQQPNTTWMKAATVWRGSRCHLFLDYFWPDVGLLTGLVVGLTLAPLLASWWRDKSSTATVKLWCHSPSLASPLPRLLNRLPPHQSSGSETSMRVYPRPPLPTAIDPHQYLLPHP